MIIVRRNKNFIRSVALFVGGLMSSVISAQQISPLLVGNNLWYANQTTGIGPSNTVWQQTKTLGTQVIRIGGNSYNDRMPSNEIMEQWVNLIRANGAEPIVQVSQHDDATPLGDRVAAARALVEYLNVTKNLQVKYWNIGNEPWLEAERPDPSTMPALVAAFIKPIAAAMKEVDPTIKIYGPDEAEFFDGYYTELFNSGSENDIGGLVPGKNYYYIDGISWHRYPQQDNVDPAVEGAADIVLRIQKAKALADAANLRHNRTGDNALQWAIGEYNSKGGSIVHTFENGQMFGQVLGASMKYEAAYAATWSMYENGGSRTGTDFSMIDGNGTPRSSYRHMEFVAQHMKGQYADGVTNNINVVAFGAVNSNQRAVMVMNRSATNSYNFALRLNKDVINSNAPLKINIDANSTQELIDSIGPKTSLFLVFDEQNVRVATYSKNHFLNDQPPTESLISLCGNNLPTIDAPASVFIDAASGSKQINITGISDGNNCTQELTITAASSNEAAVVVDSLVHSGCDTTASLTLAPQAVGSASINVTLTDSGIPATNCAPVSKAVAFNALVANPVLLPAKIQAENFDDASGLVLGDSSSDEGQHLGYSDANDYADYYVNVPQAGSYALEMRIASAATTPGGFEIRDQQGAVLDAVMVANTGDWQAYQTITLLTNLPAGVNKLRIYFTAAGVNVDWLDIKVDDGSFTECACVVNPNTSSSSQASSVFSSVSSDASSAVASSVASSYMSGGKTVLTNGNFDLDASGWVLYSFSPATTVRNVVYDPTQKVRFYTDGFELNWHGQLYQLINTTAGNTYTLACDVDTTGTNPTKVQLYIEQSVALSTIAFNTCDVAGGDAITRCELTATVPEGADYYDSKIGVRLADDIDNAGWDFYVDNCSLSTQNASSSSSLAASSSVASSEAESSSSVAAESSISSANSSESSAASDDSSSVAAVSSAQAESSSAISSVAPSSSMASSSAKSAKSAKSSKSSKSKSSKSSKASKSSKDNKGD